MRTTTPTANWLDPEPAATDQAWLADSPLLLARESEAAPLAATLPVRAQAQRYDWPKLQAAPNHLAVLLVATVTIICAAQAWGEFVGTWVPSWPLAFWLLLTWITASYVISRSSERLPRIGRSYAAVDRDGLKLRLLYGRRPVARRFFFGWANLLAPLWPRRYRLRLADISEAALYTANYGLRIGTLYWMRVWDKQGFGYTALVTSDEMPARTLLHTIKQHSQLTDFQRADAATPPTDAATRARWHTDRKRVQMQVAYSRSNAEFWHTTTPQPHLSINWRRRSVALKALTFAFLLLFVLNYNLVISLLIWSPSQPAAAGTLIPPLRELWHAAVSGAAYDDDVPSDFWQHDITRNGDGLIVSSWYSADLYSLSGKKLGQYEVKEGDTSGYPAGIGINQGNIYFARPNIYVVSMGVYKLPNITIIGNRMYFATTGKIDPQSENDTRLTAAEISSGKVLWQQPDPMLWSDKVASPKVVWDKQHNQVIAMFVKPDNDKEAVVMGLNPDNGNMIWQSDSYPVSRLWWDMVLGGDTLYVQSGNMDDSIGNKIAALDVSTGQTRWAKVTGNIFGTFTADVKGVYVQSGLEVASFAPQDGTRNDFSLPKSNTPYSPIPPHEVSRIASGDVLYRMTYDSDATTLFSGKYRLEANRLNDGQPIWRTPNLKAESPQLLLSDGILYIVHDGELHAYTGAR